MYDYFFLLLRNQIKYKFFKRYNTLEKFNRYDIKLKKKDIFSLKSSYLTGIIEEDFSVSYNGMKGKKKFVLSTKTYRLIMQ